MVLIFFFVLSLLSRLSLLHSAIDSNDSMPICQKGFTCPELGVFEYPFYNTNTSTQCGLLKVDCTERSLKFGDGRSYEIITKTGHDSILVYNKTFEQLVENRSCEVFNNFTSPSPFLFTLTILPFLTLFKCTKNPSYTKQIDAYFGPSYFCYNECKDHSLHYQYLISNIPALTNLPPGCAVIQLPVLVKDENYTPDPNNTFSLLSPRYSLSFHLSEPCKRCHDKKKARCEAENGQSQCLDAKEGGQRKVIVIAVVSGFAAFILVLSSAIFIYRRRCKRNLFSYFSSNNKSQDPEDGSVYFGVPVFSYAELEEATKNFDPSEELGDGGFGAVYYGKLRDGREVAVKRLYEHNYKRVQQFMNEVDILTRLRHRNLVLLYGCTSRRSRELLLVYEYIPNGTVADHLHGERANPRLLTWPLRMSIAIETASALAYLHASEIIHRDVKTNNILLDHNFCVKVADFGLSRLLPNDVTHVSTTPQGTPGYVDPQYHQFYQLTEKSDVYSFGVVLIELISSMPAVDISRSRDEINLANLAINRIQRCAFDQLIDPSLGSDKDAEIERMTTSVAELAFRCLQFDSDMRPTMNEVLEVLKEIQKQEGMEENDSVGEFKHVKPPPSPETEDIMLLKNFPPSPVSVADKWVSNSSLSTTSTTTGG